jgi:hypothetical protein
VRLDQGNIIFPLTGSSLCTGSEFLLAMNLGCKIEIETGIYIPFLKEGLKTELNSESIQRVDESNLQVVEIFPDNNVPSDIQKQLLLKNLQFKFAKTDFFKLVSFLIEERKKFPSKSYKNLLYKLIANSGIGQMSRGLSRKKSYNPSLRATSVIPSGPLTNPLYASWITAFIRTVISEILNDISGYNLTLSEKLIVSTTTDGFLTNIPFLNSKNFGYFSGLYRKARLNLGFTDTLLEIKHTEPKGILS